jgi:hypothetical protein
VETHEHGAAVLHFFHFVKKPMSHWVAKSGPRTGSNTALEETTVIPRSEVAVRTTQYQIDSYAERIERAYHLRRPSCRRSRVSSQVWSVAANILLSVHEKDESIPPDPELFVASQPMISFYPDPWVEIAGPDAARWYRKRVGEIVRTLRRELTAEVHLAESRIASGQNATTVLKIRTRKFSPLGSYIVAHRAGLGHLAEHFLDAAIDQHHSCPLYRQASLRLLPAELYPVHPSSQDLPDPMLGRTLPGVHLN